MNIKIDTFHQHGFFPFMFMPNLASSLDEIKQTEEEHQRQLCELMFMYQHYYGIIKQQSYVLKGSKIRCQYGTDIVSLDCIEDYGVYKGNLPVMTCWDCHEININNFGSCLCPEHNYIRRLPMTAAEKPTGQMATQAMGNHYPHICIPLIAREQGWQQINEELLLEVRPSEYAPILMDNAVLVCQYGGIISILEVPENEEQQTNDELVEAAYQTMNKWLLGGYSAVSEEDLIIAMANLAMYGEINSISSLNKVDSSPLGDMDKRINESLKRNDEYDTMILAWTNYWNMTMDYEYEGAYSPIRPEVVKAMLVTETNLGQDNTLNYINRNRSRDIMQSLDPANPLLWIVLGEESGTSINMVRDPEEAKFFGISDKETIDIEYRNPGTGEKSFFGDGSWEAVRIIVSDDLTEYYQGEVTPTLSLAVGIAYYCMRLNGAGTNDGQSLLRTEYRAVKKYNGDGDPNYCWKINYVLNNMGVDPLYEENTEK